VRRASSRTHYPTPGAPCLLSKISAISVLSQCYRRNPEHPSHDQGESLTSSQSSNGQIQTWLMPVGITFRGASPTIYQTSLHKMGNSSFLISSTKGAISDGRDTWYCCSVDRVKTALVLHFICWAKMMRRVNIQVAEPNVLNWWQKLGAVILG
jgi:hypothetical protein